VTAALTIEDLQIDVRTDDGPRAVVAGIDLVLEKGRIHGLAGESGSGKTVTILGVLGLLPDTMTARGSIALADGTELLGASRQMLDAVRGRSIAMVFQDPSTSLHPQIAVGRQLTDHMRHHLKVDKQEARERAIALLTRVRVPDPPAALKKYPHQFSGGQRQRIAIAVALACDPQILLADEPTTALDVTVQAGVLRLLRELVDETGLTVLLVTHDLGVMSAVADEVTVMRNGVVVESAPRRLLFTAPQHEYTKSLLAALPGSTLEQSPGSLVEALLEHPPSLPEESDDGR
jgi:ABC-type dipeptide/oligopeptide/nickel transport system ATPase component